MKVIVVGNQGIDAIVMHQLAMVKHQVEIVCCNNPSKLISNNNCFEKEPIIFERLTIPHINPEQFRDKRGKLFEPMRSKYHK